MAETRAEGFAERNHVAVNMPASGSGAASQSPTPTKQKPTVCLN